MIKIFEINMHACTVKVCSVPSSNGIVERCHRTAITARKGCPVVETVYLCSVTPRDDHDAATAPACKHACRGGGCIMGL